MTKAKSKEKTISKMEEQSITIDEKNEYVRVSGEKIEIGLKEGSVYFMKYPDDYKNLQKDFAWSLYSPSDCWAIELRVQNKQKGLLFSLVAKWDKEYVNNFGRRLESMLADIKRHAEEYSKDEEKANSEINKFCEIVSEGAIMKMPWNKEKFDKICQIVIEQNKLEYEANKKYEELAEILKAENIGLASFII